MIALGVHICDQRRSYVARFATDQQAVDFMVRKGATHAFHELEDEPLDESAPLTEAHLYPSCPHGLSEWLCADPINHYPADH